MTTQERLSYQTALKRVSPYKGKNPELFLDFKSNLPNALGGYKKTLLRRLDGVMNRPEQQGEGENNDREMTIYNNTNEEPYSVLFFVTTGSAQNYRESVQRRWRGRARRQHDGMACPRRKAQRH